MNRCIRTAVAIFSALICCAICVITGAAQTQKQNSEQTIKIDTTLVSVPVIVSDRQGRYIAGLKASDFALYEDRVKQPIVFFADTEDPINVALVLDTSRSAAGVLDDIKKTATDFVTQLRSQDRAMIVTFDRDMLALCELTSNRKTLERAIGNAQIGERLGTKLRDAVNAVMKEEFRTVKGRKAIVLLTDGKDHGSEIAEEALLENAAEADTLIYSVFYLSLPPGLGRDRQSPRGRWGIPGRGAGRRPRMGRPDGFFTPAPELPAPPQRPERDGRRQRRTDRIEERNEDAMDFLRRLSEVSAGRFFSSEVSNLKQTFGQIVEELRHQYRLGFYPPDHPAGSVHAIKVEVGIEGARPEVVVRSRRSYRVAGGGQSE
ncbi:MAG TPA: VWA domain-containing protein [Blastocatellia bacterium]|nr:VWA domain-containing protein [Blastocatellia bacterium]